MRSATLKLAEPAVPPAQPWSRRGALGLAAMLLGLGLLATRLGADAAREPSAPREAAEGVLQQALLQGAAHPAVRGRLLELRGALGRRPLDSLTRSVYSSLLLSLSRDADDVAAAVYHARRSVALAPVTLPVARVGVLVLAHTRNTAEAAALVRSAFGYDPAAAAAWLEQIEPLLFDRPIDEAIPEEPAAWLAWAIQLDGAGRHEEALVWVDRANRRWPEDLLVLERAAFRALHAGDFARLAELLPSGMRLPDEPIAAGVLLHRAELRAHEGDRDGARRDIERARQLDGDNPYIRMGIGAARRAAGDYAGARAEWAGMLFDLEEGEIELRRGALQDLARLEDSHGTPAAALRAWRSLLAVSPEHAEARRRVDDLTGFSRAPGR